MKTITLDTLRLEAPRNGQDLGNPRHIAMKGSVEAHHLRQTRNPHTKQIDQGDLGRQVPRRVSADAAQRIEQCRGNALRRVEAGTAIDNAMAYSSNRSETDLLVEPIDQKICRRAVIEVADDAAVVLIALQVVKRQRGATQTDTLDFAMQASL